MREAGIEKKGSCHVFRHTCATLMLERGADIRFVQAMLGHARLDTTAIYTRVSIVKLQQVHAMSHPGAPLVRYRQANASDAVVEDAGGEALETAESLLSLIAAGSEDEGIA